MSASTRGNTALTISDPAGHSASACRSLEHASRQPRARPVVIGNGKLNDDQLAGFYSKGNRPPDLKMADLLILSSRIMDYRAIGTHPNRQQ